MERLSKISRIATSIKNTVDTGSSAISHPLRTYRNFMQMDDSRKGEMIVRGDQRAETPFENKAFVLGRLFAIGILGGTIYLATKTPEAYAQIVTYIGLTGGFISAFLPYPVAMLIEKTQDIPTGMDFISKQSEARKTVERAEKEAKKSTRQARRKSPAA